MTGALSRRTLLGAALASPMLASRVWATDGFDLRIGAVLPLGGPSLSHGTENLSAIAEDARRGLALSEEEAQLNGQLFGHNVTLFLANAPGADTAERAARRLIKLNGVTVLIGGFTTDEASRLAEVAREAGVLFLNIAASSDRLRARCTPETFHVEASAAMYLDALVGWFVRAGHRNWVVLRGSDNESAARAERAAKALESRHWGARIAGVGEIGEHNFSLASALVRKKEPEAVFLLTDWYTQLNFMAHYESEGLAFPVAPFPEPPTQTRQYYWDVMVAAPRNGVSHRAALWEATLDAYGARELNARAAGRWGSLLEPVGWAAYQAVKIAFDAARYTNDTDGRAMAAYLSTEGTVLDVHKGIGVSFRPWDHQLRQSLYLVKPDPRSGAGLDIASLKSRANLVGELPAIYMPGTDPLERLDQLGDVSSSKECELWEE